MKKRNRQYSKLGTLTEVYEQQLLKKETKKRKLGSNKKQKTNKKKELEAEAGAGAETVIKKTDEILKNKTVLKKYEQLKRIEQLEEEKNKKEKIKKENKTNYLKFLNILKAKDVENKDKPKNEGPFFTVDEKKNEKQKGKIEMKKDGEVNEEEKTKRENKRDKENKKNNNFQNFEDLYLNYVIKNIRNQMKNFKTNYTNEKTENATTFKKDGNIGNIQLGIRNENQNTEKNSINGKDENEKDENGKDENEKNYDEINVDNHFINEDINREITIKQKPYDGKSYKLNSCKLDYFYTFCQNIDEHFIEAFEKKRNPNFEKEQKEKEKQKTLEDIYISSNLYISTAVSRKNKMIEKYLENHFFKNVKIQPYFFCSYLERNCVTHYLINILKTKPQCILNDCNYYNLDINLLNNTKNYITSCEPPLQYFKCIYPYMKKYFEIHLKTAEKKKQIENEEINLENELQPTLDKNKLLKKKNLWDVLKHAELKSYFHYINSYIDVMYTNVNVLNCHLIRLLNSLHIMNHIIKRKKRRQYIKKQLEILNEERQEKYKIKEQTNEGNNEEMDDEMDDDLCDESFSTPRILILCSFRYIAEEYVDLFSSLLNAKELGMKKRFHEEYGMSEKQKRIMKQAYKKKNKSIDYIDLYRGNIDDCFRLGMKIEKKKKKIRLFTPFFGSDILICSPLGLEVAIKEAKKKKKKDALDETEEGIEGEEEEEEEEEEEDDEEETDMEDLNKKNGNKKGGYKNRKAKKKIKLYEYDFLSSIDIVLIDQIDTILMQNMLTLKHVLEFINKPLVRWGRNADINRLPRYLVYGLAKNYRQTIITSSILDTQFISLIQSADNYRTFLKLFINTNDQVLLAVTKFKVKQYFKKIGCSDIQKIEDAIIHFFERNVVSILENINHLIIFIPTYIEYVRITDVLEKKDISFKGVNEYTEEKKIFQILKSFECNQFNILLITGRLMFYERYFINGAKHIMFFSPPKYIFMYYELIKNLSKNVDTSSMCYYTKFHTYELERIIGQQKTAHLMKAEDGKVTLFT